MVYFKNMISQLITDLQEKAITLLEEKQSRRKWKEIRRENIKSLWGKKQEYDHSFPRQEQGCLGKEYESLEKRHDPLEKCQGPTNRWSGGLGRGSRPLENWSGPVEEGTEPLERGTGTPWRVKTFEENTAKTKDETLTCWVTSAFLN